MYIRACIHVHMSGTCVRRQEVERRGENTLGNVEKWKVTETEGQRDSKTEGRWREWEGEWRSRGRSGKFWIAKGGCGDLGSSPSGGALVPSLMLTFEDQPSSSITRLWPPSSPQWKVGALPSSSECDRVSGGAGATGRLDLNHATCCIS